MGRAIEGACFASARVEIAREQVARRPANRIVMNAVFDWFGMAILRATATLLLLLTL